MVSKADMMELKRMSTNSYDDDKKCMNRIIQGIEKLNNSNDFKFKNIGNSPLIISSATATCGCTIPEYPKEPVAPGAEGLIRVVFNSAGKAGMQNKIISITANTVPSLTELNILGNVLAAK